MTPTDRGSDGASPEAGSSTLSTREVGRLLGVSEATVKRWADDGVLSCFKTPGGHRKFRMDHVSEFRKTHGSFAPSAGLASGAEGIETLLQMGLAGDAVGIARAITTALGRGELIEAIGDDRLMPMLVMVGERWAHGAVTVAQEHVVSGAVTDAMGQVAPLVQAEPIHGAAIVGGLEGERHDLASRFAGLVLRARHYRVVQPGADTPVEPLVELAEREQAGLIVLSAVGDAGTAARDRSLDALSKWALASGGRVIVGGSGFDALGKLPARVQRADSMRHLVALTSPRPPPR
jgi:excisionase family DNA binding protein